MASDDFNRANETPLAAPWARLTGGSGNINLVSNAVQASASGDKFYSYTGAASTADQYSQATRVTSPGSNDWAVATRIGSDNFSGYLALAFGNGELSKWVNGSYTSMLDFADAMSNGDVMRCEAEGSTVRYYRNGGNLQSHTDTSLTTAGNGPGLFIYETGGAIDDWSGGDLGAPAAEKQSFYAFRRRSVTR